MTKVRKKNFHPERSEWDIEFEHCHNIKGNINKFIRNGETKYQIIIRYGVSWLYNTVVDSLEETKEFFDKYEGNFREIDKSIHEDLCWHEMKLVQKHKEAITNYINDQKFFEYFTLK